jgi:hypothetical protein
VIENPLTTPAHWQFQTAMILAIAADALQILILPMFAQGAMSPADDLLDVAVAAILTRLVGWHWEFLPAFAAELMPGIDLVPFGRLQSSTYIASGSRHRCRKKMGVMSLRPSKANTASFLSAIRSREVACT